ncbi:protein translocase subunit SecF [Sedimentibacter sp. zth1]|uniref:protein translocase subunit SecF n=1 Tax=Sedimentibacter sp. zth1 TaxID=2816908 RepID=UPI001A92193B|nr:protein translocase subunit SecF [Sedimentibacter sp. zth1]QSX06329.1 protein translocase subunit SecF [Sedimentibacter sp. zth1]
MKINVTKYMKMFITISLIIIFTGLLFVIFRGFNQGIDFTGGTLIQIDFGEKKSVDELREITDTLDKNASIVHAGDDRSQVIIRTSKSMENDERLEFFKLFKEKFNLSDEALINQKKFEPSIGGETQLKALVSVIIATIFMLIYISIRFEFRFGIAAIVALLHDVLISVAVYAIFKLPLNSSFIAAILTIVGYSINDTIVVFDRIRENVKGMRKATFEDIVNTSVGQTVRRSINTSITTLMAIAALYIFGVESIKDFALPLIIGVLAGTYSSIFIASPTWYFLSTRKSKVNRYNANKIK